MMYVHIEAAKYHPHRIEGTEGLSYVVWEEDNLVEFRYLPLYMELIQARDL